jgi:hypothetical protein
MREKRKRGGARPGAGRPAMPTGLKKRPSDYALVSFRINPALATFLEEEARRRGTTPTRAAKKIIQDVWLGKLRPTRLPGSALSALPALLRSASKG